MKKIVVVGCTNIDILAHSYNQAILYESNPGELKRSWGGVAKNVAENLARLKLPTTLITVLGEDANDFISMAKSIDLKLLYPTVEFSSTYLAVHDKNGELIIGINDTDIITKLDKEYLSKNRRTFETASMIILDANLSDEALKFIFDNFSHIPIYVNLVSSAKALKFLPYIPQIHTLNLNTLEAETLTKLKSPFEMGQSLLDQGIKSVYLTLGKDGALHFSNQGINFYQKTLDEKVKNVTGAGDAFFAGAIYGELNGLDPLKTGTILAQLTLQTYDPVFRNIYPEKLISLIKE